MPYGWQIKFNSVDISDKVSGFTITAALQSYCREMTLDIADPDFYASLEFSQLSETPEIEIFTKTGTQWVSQGTFFIERPALNSTIHSDLLQGVWGRSSTALLGEPFAPKVSKVWDEKTSFFAICSEMCTLGGITWDPAYSDIEDFVIYPSTYEVDAAYPIDVIAELAGFAGALVTTDRLGHVCIKQIDYAPSSADFTVTDPDIEQISESPEWPTFGNRVRITPSGTVAGYALTLDIPEPCLPADEETRTKLFAQVRDEEGTPINGLVVNWSIDSENASLATENSNTQEILISGESQRASNFHTVEVAFEPSSVDGIWAYADHRRTNNFIDQGYSIDGNTITLSGALDYCDQSLVVSYRCEGMAVNYLQAGSVAEDVTVTADIEGETASADVYIDNPCACPPTITLKANPSSIHIDEASALLVYVEESGPVTAGRTVFMSEGTAQKRGSLSWTTARLGTVDVTNEESTARNEIAGVTQCEISMYPASVSGVYLADGDGEAYGSNLYASHAGKVIDLSSNLATGADLLVNYTAQGAALNHFKGESLGTARIDAYIITTREEPSEVSARISVTDEESAIDDYPEDWDAEEDDYGGPGGDGDGWDENSDSLCPQDDGTYIECPEGQRCCSDGMTYGCHPEEQCVDGGDGPGGGDVNWCIPQNVSSNPTQDALSARFGSGLEHDCSCEEMCLAEFDIFGTTQGYNGASYRPITEIIVNDYGFASGSPEYWEKYGELKDEAINACENMCTSSNMIWDPDNPETMNPSDEVAVSVIGGVGPYTWSVSGTGFSLGAGETEDGTNLLISDATACGSAKITVHDAYNDTVTGYVRSTAGEWVEKGTYCGISGSGTYLTSYPPSRTVFECVTGNKRQTQTIYTNQSGGIPCSEGTYPACSARCAVCAFGCDPCLDLPDEFEMPTYCGESSYRCNCVDDLRYYEWECEA